jgi:SEL1 protein
LAVLKKDWSFSEWVANFVQDDGRWDYDSFEDLYDDTAMPGGDAALPDELGEDDGVVETLFIIGLMAVLAFLVYYRNQRQAAARRAEEEQRARLNGVPLAPAAVADRGVFPPPGDPAVADWAVGGIGH